MFVSSAMCACVQAKLHQARAETREAAHYFRMNLERIEAENITGSDQLDALIYLAEYAKVHYLPALGTSSLSPWLGSKAALCTS